MRKLIPISAVFALLALLSMSDYDMCSGASTAKAACSACHIGSITGEVFILNGKVEDDGGRLDENEYEATVRIPLSDYTVLQMNTITEESFPGRVEVDLAEALIDLKNNSLFAISDLFQRKSNGKETEDISVRFTLDEKLTESKTVVLQGVLGNGDGTVEGDLAFYKEITLEPKEGDINSANLSIVQDGINYYPSHTVLEVVSLEKAEVLRIVDLQGKVVLNQQVESLTSIDLSSLNKGYYIAILGSSGKDMITYKFVR